MNRFLGVLIILGIIIWGFLMWDRARPDEFAEKNFDDATKAERCKEFEQKVPGDEGDSILGYGGRLRQLTRGCF